MRLALSLFLFTAHAALGQIPAPTKSQEYSWLASDTARILQFKSRAQAEVQKLLQQSANLATLEQRLLAGYPANVAELSAVNLGDGRRIVLSRKNFHHVVREVDGTQERVLFTTESELPELAQVASLNLSPDRRFLVIMAQLNGNIDVSRYYIYNVAARRLQGQFDGLSYMRPPYWSSGHELVTMHPASSPRLSSVLFVDLENMTFRVRVSHDAYGFKDWVAVTSESTGSGELINARSGTRLAVNVHLPFLNDIEETPAAFYYVLHTHTDGTIFRLAKHDHAFPEAFIPPRPGHWLSYMKLLGSDYLLVDYSRDSIVTLVLYDLRDGRALSELTLPDNYDMSGAQLTASQDTIELEVSDFLGTAHTVRWNIADPAQTDLSSLPARFFVGAREIVSQLELFTSHDGERVPARLVYLKETLLTGSNPTYIETYGAFNYISGYLTPYLDQMKFEFLKRGGILVGTGVRGGAERGYSWYQRGTGALKINAALDLVAIADGLVERGLTRSEKIVSTGVSAGGDNVAIAAQLSPTSFGLVIPLSGIHDALAYPELDRWGPQWFADYLNPYEARNFKTILSRAPLELRVAAPRYPQYFIVSGESDSRVSKVHSYKLKASLDEFNAGNVHLYSVENAGHWPNSAELQGLQGVRVNAAIWARVFDYLSL